MTLTLVALGTLSLGYALGRWQPAAHALDWAMREGRRQPTGPRYWTVWTVKSIDNLLWIARHPIKSLHAWRHRHNPPPPLSPPIQVRKINKGNS